MRNKHPRLLATLYPIIDEFYSDYDDFDRSCLRMREHYEASKRLLETGKPIVPEGVTFLSGTMHDSWLLSVQRNKGEVLFSFNEFMTHCFCEAYNTLLQQEVPHEKVTTRVHFRFMGAVSIGVCRGNNKGRLLPVSTDRYLPFFDELLITEVRRLDANGVEAGFAFTNRRAFDRTLVLEIKADRLIIEESLRDDCIGICGPDISPYFDAYMRQRRDANDYFDYSSSLEFLKSLGIPEPL